MTILQQKRLKTGVLGGLITWLPYLAPALFFYILFMAWPLVDSLRLSLYTGSGRHFVGFENFKKLFTVEPYSQRYWGAFGHTLYFFLIHILVQNCLGILFATLLTNKSMKGAGFYQTVLFIPVTLAVLVTGYLWKLMLNPVWSGPFLEKLRLGFLARPWLGDRTTALTSVALVSCWQWIGIPTMMFVAALRNISEDFFE
ncbi:MAG: sugar ABC transporter permease, partial [Treponema sp.]|nr:sugar ABC transporter permease [Treponema sp.]